MAMSSFLMNSSPFAEPKFPPSEDYSHGYLPTNTQDYYRPQTDAYYAHDGHYEERKDYSQQQQQPGYHHHYNGVTQPNRLSPENVSLCHVASSPETASPVTDSQTSSQPAIIYPWMKKVHSNNTGTWVETR